MYRRSSGAEKGCVSRAVPVSSIAQEESRNLSQNVTWGQRKRFADGKVSMPYKRFLGYDKGEDGNPVINPEQAELVRRIYRMCRNAKRVALEGFIKALRKRDLLLTEFDEALWNAVVEKVVVKSVDEVVFVLRDGDEVEWRAIMTDN